MTEPQIRWRLFTLPKRGHSAEEYEDAAAGHAGNGRFAVADGASESAFAADWSRLLVESFVQTPLEPKSWADWLPPVQQRWSEKVGGQALPWYAEEKFHQGAFAAFLGVELRPRPKGPGFEWRAVAVGDCCLFQVRHARLEAKFPIMRSVDFDSSPDLLGSRQRPGNGQPLRDRWKKGLLRPGDRLFCVSDALAQWFLGQCEKAKSPWDDLAKVTVDGEFGPWVDALRDRKEVRNDDMTLLVLEL